jgi:hypothetical protein
MRQPVLKKELLPPRAAFITTVVLLLCIFNFYCLIISNNAVEEGSLFEMFHQLHGNSDYPFPSFEPTQYNGINCDLIKDVNFAADVQEAREIQGRAESVDTESDEAYLSDEYRVNEDRVDEDRAEVATGFHNWRVNHARGDYKFRGPCLHTSCLRCLAKAKAVQLETSSQYPSRPRLTTNKQLSCCTD